MQVQPQSARHAVHVTLREADLDDGPSFDCLSYTWQKVDFRSWISATLWPFGGLYSVKSGPARVIVCNRKSIHVGENLYDFLLQLRQLPNMRSRPVWIDAICINQRDLAERSGQVNMMERIYRSADCVIVWLGEAAGGAEAGVRFMQTLPEAATVRTSCHTRDYVLGQAGEAQLLEQMFATRKSYVTAYFGGSSMSRILSREYFRRMWVVQEMVLARQLRFYVGATEIPVGALQRSISFMSRVLSMPAFAAMRYFIPMRTGVLSMPFIFQARERLHAADAVSWSLEDYIALCRDQAATEPADKVYALLGVANATSLARAEEGARIPSQQMALHADYAKGIAEVYLQCMRVLLSQTSLSKVLSLVGKLDAGVRSLPSWVFDLSVSLRPKPFAAFGPVCFRASGSTTDSHSISADGRHLRLAASLVDTIAKTGESSVALSIFHRIHLRGLMLDLVSDCGPTYVPTGEPTLVAFQRTMTADILSSAAPEMRLADLQAGFVAWLGGVFHATVNVKRSWLMRCALHALWYYTVWTVPDQRSTTEFGDRDLSLESAVWRFNDVVGLGTGPVSDDLAEKMALVVETVYQDRRIFRTEKGYLGIGTSKLMPGDQVMLVAGVDVPLMFRDDRNGQTLSLVGPAYVHGIMNGEALKEVEHEFRSICVA